MQIIIQPALHKRLPSCGKSRRVTLLIRVVYPLQQALGNLQQALTFFEERSRLGKELYEAYPQNVSFKNGLDISYSQLGRFYRDKKGDNAKVREYFQQCFTLWKELSEAYPAYVEFRNNFDWAKNALEGL